MITVVSKQVMRAMDYYMTETMYIPSRILMENAALGLTQAVCQRCSPGARIAAVCGPGNNGGDGFAAARQLEAKGYSVSVFLAGRVSALSGDAAENAAYFGGRIIEMTSEYEVRKKLRALLGCTVVIDALLGTGLARNAEGLFAAAIEMVNSSGAYIIACDIPSGIDADTGSVLGAAVMADETVTFQCAKPGHFLFPGRSHTGNLTIKEIGTAPGFHTGGMRAVTDGLMLQKRPADAHKGSFGRLACVAGSRGFAGAAIMCVMGALRAGAGLITAGIPTSLQDAVSARCPESMTFALDEASGTLSNNCTDGLDVLLHGKTALAAGPGLSVSEGAKKAVRHMVTMGAIRKVFDADALNVIAQEKEILENSAGDIVLTPHPAEFARLCGCSVEEILRDPVCAARGFASDNGVTVLLKGATTIVTNGAKTALVPVGSPGMAKGGSGDVLTGVIGGLMCGGREGGMDAFPAALYGAYICGRAGEAAAADKGEYSMTPLDTLSKIPDVMKSMRQ